MQEVISSIFPRHFPRVAASSQLWDLPTNDLSGHVSRMDAHHFKESDPTQKKLLGILIDRVVGN